MLLVTIFFQVVYLFVFHGQIFNNNVVTILINRIACVLIKLITKSDVIDNLREKHASKKCVLN